MLSPTEFEALAARLVPFLDTLEGPAAYAVDDVYTDLLAEARSSAPEPRLELMFIRQRDGKTIETRAVINSDGSYSQSIVDSGSDSLLLGENVDLLTQLGTVFAEHVHDFTDPTPAELAQTVRERNGGWQKALARLVALADRSGETA